MEREQLNYLLQQAPTAQLEALCEKISQEAAIEVIQKPISQTLLLPAHDPINQGTFLTGEVLVTSAIVQVKGVNGWAMVMDDNPDLAAHVAILDGAFAGGICKAEIVKLAKEGEVLLDRQNREVNGRVHSTRVAFDLL